MPIDDIRVVAALVRFRKAERSLALTVLGTLGEAPVRFRAVLGDRLAV